MTEAPGHPLHSLHDEGDSGAPQGRQQRCCWPHARLSERAPSRGGEEAATEEEEQEQEPVAEAAAAPGKPPALGKKDLTRLVERFGALGFHLPKDIEKLNPEDARILYNTHLQTWGLTITGGNL